MHRAVNAVRLESYVMVFPFESVLYDWPSVIKLLKLSKVSRCIGRFWARTSNDYSYKQHCNLGSHFIIVQTTAREKTLRQFLRSSDQVNGWAIK